MRNIIPIITSFLFMIMLCLPSCAPVEETPQETVQQEDVQVNKTPDSRETTVGPVHAVVLLDNAKPTLGDSITLSLIVDSEENVAITMPEFGDQLGAFNIVDYKSTEKQREDGRFEYTQAYTLDLPRSGKLKTPSFLVEFTDNRPGSEYQGQFQELLTETMTFEVASVFENGEVPDELFPPEDELPELVLPDVEKKQYTLWMIIGAIVLVAGICIVIFAGRRKKEVVIPADIVAMEALEKMSQRPIPYETHQEVDEWYVELSGILRHYIEGRFSLHAPKLTTEEFMDRARKSEFFGDEHKLLIRKLLERSDRVKFTDHVPEKEDSLEALADAKRFVSETRPQPEEDHHDTPSEVKEVKNV